MSDGWKVTVNDEVTCFRVLDPGGLRLFASRIPAAYTYTSELDTRPTTYYFGGLYIHSSSCCLVIFGIGFAYLYIESPPGFARILDVTVA